jgi:hypothetical protein
MTGTVYIIALIIGLLSSSALARDLSGLYNDAELLAVKERYELSVRQIYDQLILPGLNESEKRALREMKFSYPLRSPKNYAESTGYPFAFLTTGDHSTVVMPLFSLKFLHDLCTAYAWLQINNYTVETVSEYIGMLKYGLPKNLPAGRYPSPLKALRIPEDGLSNPQVKELTHLHFTTARAFILAHELGHIVHNHPPYVPGEKRKASISDQLKRNEAEADSFALDVLQVDVRVRGGITPLGALIFFLADAHISPQRVDFGNEREFREYLDSRATHPLTPDRVELLTNKMRRLDPEDRKTMRDITEFLKDEEVQQSYILSGQATDQDALGPRRPGQLLSRVWPRQEASEPRQPFDGLYFAESATYVSGKQVISPVEVRFERRGDRVTGRYSFGSYRDGQRVISSSRIGEGVISAGQVKGNTLHFHWEWGSHSGDGTLHSLENGTKFSGTWGYQGRSDGGGEWKGRRTQ